jgi:hypothetical protein
MGRARDTLKAIERRVAPDLIHLNSYREAAFDWSAPSRSIRPASTAAPWKAAPLSELAMTRSGQDEIRALQLRILRRS